MTVTDWLFWGAAGIFLGLIWAWSWIVGRIAEHAEYWDWEEKGPQWFFIAGKPKQGSVAHGSYTYNPPKAVSLVGLVGTLIFYHYYVVWPALTKGVTAVFLAETSFTLFLLLTWIALIFIAERSLKRLRSRRSKTDNNG